MKLHYVVAEYESMEFARIGLEVLAKQGLTEENVSFVTRENDEALTSMTEATQDDPEMAIQPESEEGDESPGITASRSAAGAGVGAAVTAGLAIPLSMMTVVAPFFLAGPLAAAVIGAAGGGLIGAGISGDEDKTKDYRQKVENGSILIIVSGDEYLVYEATSSLKTTRNATVETFTVEVVEDETDE
jgi:hypothetical protein